MKRRCWICKTEKELEIDFYKDCIDALGYQKACKDCQKKRNNKYRETHGEYFKQKGLENYEKEKEKDPDFNKKRYVKYKPQYKKREDEWLRSVRGRLYSLFQSAKERAKKYNFSIEIDLDFLLERFEKIKGKCELSEIPFSFERFGKIKRNPFALSLDRIDSEKGYTKDNVRLVCVIVNLSLNNFGDEAFFKMCEAVTNKRKGNAK